MPDEQRAVVMDVLVRLRMALWEELLDKLGFWMSIPFKALGVFYCFCGGDEAVSQRILRECILEYDEAVASGKGTHRVSDRLFQKGGDCRREFDP